MAVVVPSLNVPNQSRHARIVRSRLSENVVNVMVGKKEANKKKEGNSATDVCALALLWFASQAKTKKDFIRGGRFPKDRNVRPRVGDFYGTR